MTYTLLFVSNWAYTKLFNIFNVNTKMLVVITPDGEIKLEMSDCLIYVYIRAKIKFFNEIAKYLNSFLM